MEILITDWALQTYLDLKRNNCFTRREYKTIIRPDVELLRDNYPAHTKFQNNKFWSVATDKNGCSIQFGYKMKWHNMGHGKVQLRLAIALINEKAFVCRGYIKASTNIDKMEMARFKIHIRNVLLNQYVYRGGIMNTPFTTTDEQKVKVYMIATQMKDAGLSNFFISNAVELALQYEGAFDLMEIWSSNENKKEREELVSVIQEEIDNYKELPREPIKKPYICFDDLDAIAKNVKRFKEAVRKFVDKNGGISELSKKTGIPQPSLSRFFNSSSMPRRTTLYKIANAIGLSEKDIAFDWIS